MTIQQVNLYVPELRPRREWLTADALAAIVAGFIVLLIVAGIMFDQGLRDFEQQVASVQLQVEESEARVERARKMPKPANARKLDREIEKLRSMVASREKVGRIIQGQNLGNEAGFSEPMLSFARQYIDSIALEHIRLSRGGAFVELRGETRLPKDIPLFLQRLNNEPSLSEAQFGLLSVQQKSSGSSLHQFALGFESLSQLASKEGR